MHWDYEKYLNIWVLTANGRNLGYGAFPYDANVRGLEFDQTSLNEQKQFDGVIIDYRYFGTVGAVTSKTYGWGRTASHEIGHWLGLLHPNGDIRCGDDYCNDTPTIESLNNSTNCNKITSNCTGVVVQNMIENYMDYSPDFCMNVFTQDQKDRVRSVLDKSPTRQKIVTANIDLPESDKLAITIKPNPTSDLAKIEVLFKSTKSIYVNVFDYSGKSFYTNTYENQSSSLIYLDTSKYPNGNYILQVIAGDESLSKHLIVNR
ncbi:M43 family zinc metalloprotease [Pseudarcicella hirudinis]|uniref:M43 family zinc metalloprotease n=1 Tax=Pseudarcicella hirudinis TaxID=1079859 RepID=UPI0035F0A4D5